MKQFKFILIILTCFIVTNTKAQMDSLEQRLLESSAEEKVQIYIQLTNKYSRKNIPKAIGFAKRGLEVLKDSINKHSGLLHVRLGNLYSDASKLDSAMYHYKETLRMAKSLNLNLSIGKSYHNIGVIYKRLGNYKEALDLYLKALKIYEDENKDNLIVGLSNNMGTLYSCTLKDDERANVYYQKALKLSEKPENKTYRAHVLVNISEMYMRQKRYAIARKNLNEVLKISETHDNLGIEITALNNLAQISIEEKKYNEAEKYAQSILDKTEITGYSEDKTLAYLTLANVYEQINNQQKAEESYKLALELANKINALPKLSEVYEAMHLYYHRKKEDAKSYQYLVRYNTIKDSLFNKEKNKQLKEIEARFDVASKDKELKLLANQNKVKDLENKNQRNTLLFLSLGIFLLALVIAGLVYAYKSKQKTNKKLEEALNDNQILLKEVHHRVKNNLQIVSSLLNLQNQFSAKKSSVEIIQEIQNKIQAMAIIHERLYKSSDLSTINLQSYLENLLSYFSTSYNLPEQNIQIKTNIDKIYLDMDHLVPCGLIINEIIANSIKYAFPNEKSGIITIEARQNNEICAIKIMDSGIGLPNDFKIENSPSLGMKLIQGLTKQIKGTVNIISNPGVSYTITFQTTT